MARYEPGDIVTYHFIVYNDGRHKNIRAWTDNKDLAKMYMEFHQCKDFTIKSVTKRIEEISAITEENLHDEIRIHNILIRNTDKRKKGEETKIISIPATETECLFINDECSTFMLSRIRYSYLNTAIPYMKKKYRDGLESIFLQDIINKVCNERSSNISESVKLDQLMVLFRSLPEFFGV